MKKLKLLSVVLMLLMLFAACTQAQKGGNVTVLDSYCFTLPDDYTVTTDENGFVNISLPGSSDPAIAEYRGSKGTNPAFASLVLKKTLTYTAYQNGAAKGSYVFSGSTLVTYRFLSFFVGPNGTEYLVLSDGIPDSVLEQIAASFRPSDAG